MINLDDDWLKQPWTSWTKVLVNTCWQCGTTRCRQWRWRQIFLRSPSRRSGPSSRRGGPPVLSLCTWSPSPGWEQHRAGQVSESNSSHLIWCPHRNSNSTFYCECSETQHGSQLSFKTSAVGSNSIRAFTLNFGRWFHLDQFPCWCGGLITVSNGHKQGMRCWGGATGPRPSGPRPFIIIVFMLRYCWVFYFFFFLYYFNCLVVFEMF